MRVLVCGGRDYTDKDRVFSMLDFEHSHCAITCVITGGASGADMFARLWALTHDVSTETYPADWTQFGRRAGPIRNAQMLANAKPERVLAFPGGRGTADMVNKARSAGVTVREVAA